MSLSDSVDAEIRRLKRDLAIARRRAWWIRNRRDIALAAVIAVVSTSAVVALIALQVWLP